MRMTTKTSSGRFASAKWRPKFSRPARSAAPPAKAHDFIMRLPGGGDTLAGDQRPPDGCGETVAKNFSKPP
jgi:hypothetical protein